MTNTSGISCTSSSSLRLGASGNIIISDTSNVVSVYQPDGQTYATLRSAYPVGVSDVVTLQYILDTVSTTGGGTGTVTSVGTNSSLTGGPITSIGTLGLNLANSNTWTSSQTYSVGLVVTGTASRTLSNGTGVVSSNSINGLILQGQGSTNDLYIENNAGAAVLTAASGTTNVSFPGAIQIGSVVGGFKGAGTINATQIYQNGTLLAASATTDTTNASNISSGNLSLSRIATIPANTILGNITTGAAAPSSVTQTQLTALVNIFSSSLPGLAPASGGGSTNFLRADGSWTAPAQSVNPIIYGLIMSNDTTTPNTVIDIAPGGGYDFTGSTYIRLASVFKKNVTTSWIAGSGNGSLDTGAITSSGGNTAAGRFYHVHLIFNPTSNLVDVLTSLSYSSPTLPSGYTYFIPIGAFLYTSSNVVQPFTQIGNHFILNTQYNDLAASGITSSSALCNLTVPPGLSIISRIRVCLAANTGTGSEAVCISMITSPYEADVLPNTYGPASIGVQSYSGNVNTDGVELSTITNTSGQVRYRSNTTYASAQLDIWTFGYDYPRGLQ